MATDPDLQLLKEDIITNKTCCNNLVSFQKIFHELSYIEGIIMRGSQDVIPTSLQAEVIGLAHEGHMGADKTLNLLEQSCWFPKMGQLVREYVRTCLPCAAAVTHPPPVPLKPNLLAECPWQNLHADFKGPIGEKHYLHVVINQYSKYPEVDIVSATSFSKLEPYLDRIMETHGIREQLTTDNGSPYFSDEMAQYAKRMGFKHHPVTPKDPQSNGFAESFVKLLCKLVHTAIAEGKDPKRELHNYLLQYRATPHTTLGKSPAEVLFGKKIQTKLPQYHPISHTKELKDMHTHHNNKKLLQKALLDKRHKAQPKPVYVGDKVLLEQDKSTTKPPFDPILTMSSKPKGVK